MAIIEGTMEWRKSKILLSIRDKTPGMMIEKYLHDENVAGMDAVVSIITPMGKKEGNEYVQVVTTLCIIRKADDIEFKGGEPA